MALNFSHRPIFPAHLPEENIVQGGSQDRDIRELLPADPFGMDISSTVTAITGWLEDLGADYGGYGRAEVGGFKGDYPLFAGWNFWWNAAAMEFQKFPENKKFDERILKGTGVDSYFPEEGLQFYSLDRAKYGSAGNASIDKIDSHWKIIGDDGYLQKGGSVHLVNDGGVRFACPLDGAKFCIGTDSFDRDDNNCGKSAEVNDGDAHFACTLDGANFGTGNDSFDRDDGNCGKSTDDISETETPHPALSYALAYLGVRDLLSVERVCKSLCCTVQNDPLLWRSIHIDNRITDERFKPLNEWITDDVLLQLTNRAQGSLHCLSLVDCQRVTDDGLKRVLDINLRLTKLSVPGCTKLTIDGVVNCLRAFKTVAVNGIKHLRVCGIRDVTQKHFEELMSLLDIRNQVQNNSHKPHFYQRRNAYLSIKDERPIDIEMCPRCQNLRLVYDCPAEGCQGKDHSTELCRACLFCIARCDQCGKCIDDCEYEETFCLESLCFVCWEQVVQCQERQDVGISPLKHAISQEPVISSNG